MNPKHRLFVDPEQISGEVVRLAPTQSHRLSRVLRLRPGDRIVVLDGCGHQAPAEVSSLDRLAGTLRVDAWEPAPPEPRCQIVLHQALIKHDRFEWVVQKGTEIGVSVFVPLITERCVVRRVDEARLERWQTIAREAAEQSRRGRVPVVLPPASIGNLAPADGPLVVLWEDAEDVRLRTVLEALGPPPARLGLVTGPEGGLSAAEVEHLRERGALVAGLGPRILRAETAGPIAAALSLFCFQDLG